MAKFVNNFPVSKVIVMAKIDQDNRRPKYYIFRTWITRKDGTRDYARDHGYKAWRIPVYE